MLETELFAEAVYRQYGVDLRGFEREWLLGRLTAFSERQTTGSISALQGEVLRDSSAAREAFRFVSASDSTFFTRPTSFIALRCAVLPLLRSVSWPVVWIAECADSAFLIQLVVMLEEEGLLSRTELFVTNANEELLSRAASLRLAPSEFPVRDEQHMRGGGSAPLYNYFEQEAEGYVLQDRLRQHIVWSQHDLSTDSSFNECHVVICQRRLTDYGSALRKRALKLFAESLCNFGILQLDASSGSVVPDLIHGFTSLLAEQGIYKRMPFPSYPIT
jgi:chemotaxis protein methyltransferase CheR